jgi:hypothetical protein
MLNFRNERRDPRRKGKTDMDAETVPDPARPKLNPYTKALRRERFFSRLRLGTSYREIACEERVSEQRVRKIVSDALDQQGTDLPADHALLQLVRLEGAHAVAAQAIAAGDLRAVGPYLNVLERLDRYHAGAKKDAYDDEGAWEKLLGKMNRILARLEVDDARKAAKQAAASLPGAAREMGHDSDSGSSL